MKKLLCLLLAIAMLFVLVACQAKPNDGGSSKPTKDQQVDEQDKEDVEDEEDEENEDDTYDDENYDDEDYDDEDYDEEDEDDTYDDEDEDMTDTEETSSSKKTTVKKEVNKATTKKTKVTTTKPGVIRTTLKRKTSSTKATTTTVITEQTSTTIGEVSTTPATQVGTTPARPVSTTEDPANYVSHTDTVKDLIAAGKWLAQGRAALVADEFQMDYSNAGFEIKGKLGGKIAITATNDRDTTVLNVIVDGGAPIEVTVAKGTAETVLIPYLSKGRHTIKVISGTSARYGGFSITSISYDGELDTISRASDKLTIEVIGDSISCGSGLDIPGSGPAWNNSITYAQEILGSNAYYSYAAVAARALNADLSVAARCSYTLAQMKSYYKNLNLRTGAAAWDFENNQVDIVVINLGTNGGGTVADVKNMILDVRSNYSDAAIIWVSGMMKSTEGDIAITPAAEAAVQELKGAGDAKLYTLNLRQYDTVGGYDGGHPTRAEHQVSGAVLAQFIQDNVI